MSADTRLCNKKLPQPTREAHEVSLAVSEDTGLFCWSHPLTTTSESPWHRLSISTLARKLIPSKYSACVPIETVSASLKDLAHSPQSNRTVDDSLQQTEGLWDLGQLKAQPTFRIYCLNQTLLVHWEMKFVNLFCFANDSPTMPMNLGKWFLLESNGFCCQINRQSETSVAIGCSYPSSLLCLGRAQAS